MSNSYRDLGIPFTRDTLREAANRIDEIIKDLPYDNELIPDDHWLWGIQVDVIVDNYKVGQLRPYNDGWLGFYPEGWD